MSVPSFLHKESDLKVLYTIHLQQTKMHRSETVKGPFEKIIL